MAHLPPSQPAPVPSNRGRRALVSALLVFLIVVVGLLVIGASFLALWRPDRASNGGGNTTPAPTVVAQASPTLTTRSTPAVTGVVTAAARPSPAATISAEQNLLNLSGIEVPPRDLYSIVARLKLKSGEPIPRTNGKPAGNYTVGHTDTFFLHDLVERNYYTITARVHVVTENAYWYVEEGESVDAEALADVARVFETRIYPANTRVFGTEWKPGVDNDPRITVLLADIPSVGGYYSSADQHTRAVNPYSNEREMFYINAGVRWSDMAGTLAHEHQHMIHWYASPNHDVWLNEGLAVLAESLNGFGTGGLTEGFMRDPDLQLNAWQQTPSESLRHYGAAFLFLEYLRSHYGGEKMARALITADGQGSSAVDNALESLGYPERFEDLFKEWVAANLLDEEEDASREQTYPDQEVEVRIQERVRSFPRTLEGTVAQFGTDYIEVLPPTGGGDVVVEFEGAPEVGLVSTGAVSGSHFWWSNRGDVSNTSMTRRFDLRGTESATLDFSLWYDIEPDFDYGYVEVSTDGGETWDTLAGGHTTTGNPNGTNLGNSYTGKSAERDGADAEGWLRESIDLSGYAGEEIHVRFEYITDDGYNAQGMAVDDIAIPEIGYSDGAEGGSDWQKSGFAHVSGKLPQRYHVAAVLFGDGPPQVREIAVGANGKATFTIEELGSKYESAVLVVSGITPHTLQRAQYELELFVRE